LQFHDGFGTGRFLLFRKQVFVFPVGRCVLLMGIGKNTQTVKPEITNKIRKIAISFREDKSQHL
jgi:hypothetical protein